METGNRNVSFFFFFPLLLISEGSGFGLGREIYMLTKDLFGGGGSQIHGCDACACVCCELKHFPGSDEIKRNWLLF